MGSSLKPFLALKPFTALEPFSALKPFLALKQGDYFLHPPKSSSPKKIEEFWEEFWEECEEILGGFWDNVFDNC